MKGRGFFIFHLPFFCQRKWGCLRALRRRALQWENSVNEFVPFLPAPGNIHTPRESETSLRVIPRTHPRSDRSRARSRLERGCVQSDEISRSNGTESGDVWGSRDESTKRCPGLGRWQKDGR